MLRYSRAIHPEEDPYPYRWRLRVLLPERCGHACRVLAWGGANEIVVEFPDGKRIRVSRNAVRRRRLGLPRAPRAPLALAPA